MNEGETTERPEGDYRLLTTMLLQWVMGKAAEDKIPKRRREGVYIRAAVVHYFLNVAESTEGQATQTGYAESIGISKASFNRFSSQFCKDFNFRAPGTFNPEAKRKLSQLHSKCS